MAEILVQEERRNFSVVPIVLHGNDWYKLRKEVELGETEEQKLFAIMTIWG